MLLDIFLGIHTLDFYISNVLNNTQIKGGYQMTNLGLELLILTVLIIYFGVFMTQNIYKQYEKAYLRKTIFCSKSKSDPYFIAE